MRLAACAVLLCGVVLLFVFHPFSPALPRAGIDPSWVAVMGEAADRPARWGVDTVFTYGPASPLVTVYYNAGFFSRTLPLMVGYAALFGWCAALLLAHRGARAAAAGTAALALVVSAARGTPDVLFLTLPVLVFLVALRAREGRSFAAASACGAVALGLTAMAKMSFPLAALPLMLLADGLALARHRRIPRLAPLFALGVVAGALLYGQRLSDLPAYLRGQGEVVAGYAAAMAIDGPDWDLIPFLLAAASLPAAVLLQRRSRDRWPVALALGMALLFLFKAGFIRHDLHSTIAWTGLALLATVVAWNRLPHRAALAATAAAGFVVLVYEPVATVRQSVRLDRPAALANLYRSWLVETPRDGILAAGRALADPAGFRAALAAEKAAAWAEIAASSPEAKLSGTVDIIPSDQTRVLAEGWNYRGRPSFQEYSTYTARLAADNRAFLEGPQAPRWLLFGPESPLGYFGLDGRYPSLAEGPLWPDLLRLYRPDHRIGDLVALERRATPARLGFGPVRSLATGFGEVVPIGDDGPLWVRIDLRLDAAGALLSALFRPPLVTLAVRLDDGSERRFRLVPALAAAGFLLSPLVDNASDYEVLAQGRAAGAGRRVTALAVEVSRAGRAFYAPDVALALRRLDLGGLAADATPAATDATAFDALARAEGAGNGRVRAPASGLLTLPLAGLPVTGGRRHVDLAPGVGPDGAGACFAALAADGTRQVLWRSCAGADPAAAGPAALSLDVPESITELALTVSCAASRCDAFWAAPGPAAAELR